MKGYKGFNNKLQCNPNDTPFQYEVGKEYETDNAILCRKGFHFCENPLDVFNYYAPANSRYCEVEGSGEIVKNDGGDTKVAASKIKIGAEIGLQDLIAAGVKFILEKATWKTISNDENQSVATNTGDRSAATNTGNQSAATNTGYQSVATNTGNWSVATNTGYRSAAIVGGEESVAISLGIMGKAKGALGCWLVLAEWTSDIDGKWHKKSVQCARVDGKKIKADTFYTLKGDKFVEMEENQ